MKKITLDKLMNTTPIGSLLKDYWITRGGAIIPKERNEFAEYELTENPDEEILELSDENYQILTDPLIERMIEELTEFTKHLPGKHDQSTHGRKKGVSFNTDSYASLTDETGEAFQTAMSNLSAYDGASISEEVIDKAHLRYQFRSQKMPEEFGMDYGSLDKSINKYLDENPVSVMMEEEVIDSILDDGEIKSYLWTQRRRKGQRVCRTSTCLRKGGFRLRPEYPIGVRPVSGTVFPKSSNNQAVVGFGTGYGSTQIVLNDDVKSRTTFTIGDSLDKFQRPTKYGGKVPRTLDLGRVAQSNSNANKKGINIFEEKGFNSFDYIETQVHGGIKLSDINKIVFHSPMYIDMEATTNRLNDMGIGWEVVDG
jgi:hypothetical protein